MLSAGSIRAEYPEIVPFSDAARDSAEACYCIGGAALMFTEGKRAPADYGADDRWPDEVAFAMCVADLTGAPLTDQDVDVLSAFSGNLEPLDDEHLRPEEEGAVGARAIDLRNLCHAAMQANDQGDFEKAWNLLEAAMQRGYGRGTA